MAYELVSPLLRMAASKATMRLAAARRCAQSASPPSRCARSFATSVLRAKETASQDVRPNLRHAQRPRMLHNW